MSKTKKSLIISALFTMSFGTQVQANCWTQNTQAGCEAQGNCYWVPGGPLCVGDQHCFGLSEHDCGSANGCYWSVPPADFGFCYAQ